MTTGNIMNSYGKRTVKKADQPRKYAMQWPTLSALTALAIGLASLSQEQAGYTGAERKCTVRRYYDYNAKQLSQCVDFCKACLWHRHNLQHCKLKGASL
jgi:hypothetical protein